MRVTEPDDDSLDDKSIWNFQMKRLCVVKGKTFTNTIDWKSKPEYRIDRLTKAKLSKLA